MPRANANRASSFVRATPGSRMMARVSENGVLTRLVFGSRGSCRDGLRHHRRPRRAGGRREGVPERPLAPDRARGRHRARSVDRARLLARAGRKPPGRQAPGRRRARRDRRTRARDPLSAVAPTAILVLGALGIFKGTTATWLAVGVCVVALTVQGLRYALLERLGTVGTLSRSRSTSLSASLSH